MNESEKAHAVGMLAAQAAVDRLKGGFATTNDEIGYAAASAYLASQKRMPQSKSASQPVMMTAEEYKNYLAKTADNEVAKQAQGKVPPSTEGAYCEARRSAVPNWFGGPHTPPFGE